MEYEVLEYRPEMGPVNWQEGFREELLGRPIEEQLRCYGWMEDRRMMDVPFREAEAYIRQQGWESSVSPVQSSRIILMDGLVAGVRLWNGIRILPYQGYAYDSDSDNNGAGYKEREYYEYLICLPFEHTLW